MAIRRHEGRRSSKFRDSSADRQIRSECGFGLDLLAPLCEAHVVLGLALAYVDMLFEPGQPPAVLDKALDLNEGFAGGDRRGEGGPGGVARRDDVRADFFRQARQPVAEIYTHARPPFLRSPAISSKSPASRSAAAA